jgi:hypothetical protein
MARSGTRLYQGEPGYELPDPDKIGARRGTDIGDRTGFKGWPGVHTDDQYIRKWTLSLGGAGKGGLVLTTETPGRDFRCVFKVRHADSETPGTLEARIYNLKLTTANEVIKEFKSVELQAGYVNGHYGTIFQGGIKQFKRGRESAVDSYLDIFAADGDAAWNFGFLNFTLPPGTDYVKGANDQLTKAAEKHGVTKGEILLTGGIKPLLRSAVGYGDLTDEARAWTRTTGATWTIQNNKIQVLPSTQYKRGDVVVINSGTGMVGVPEVTEQGIYVQTLLNPNLYVKGRVQIDERTLNQFFLPGGGRIGSNVEASRVDPQYKAQPRYFASIANDGIYCILVIDHEGDTRGLPWYSKLTCLNVDPTDSLNPVKTAGDWVPPAGQGEVPGGAPT